tara:strand:+ start:571 stop:1836 length:1266 start_codon:yes stop_codon:yes gene_type:complete
MSNKNKRQTKIIRSSLRISTIEGSWWAVMYGSVESYLGAFFEILKYSSFQISVLTTLPFFIGSLFQNYVNNFYHFFKSRKILVVSLKILQSFLIPTIYLIGVKINNFYLFLLVICIYFVIAISQLSPWTSWMGYLVPSRLRGRYFGSRSQIIRIFMLVSSLFAGVVLNSFNNTNPLVGFGIIFAIGIIANIGSAYYIYSQYEPDYETVEEKNKKLNLTDNEFKPLKKFITYDSLSEFSFSISGPLMMVYWLRELNFNYIELALLINVSQLIGLFSLRYWGKKIDYLGANITIRWTSLTISVFPLLWILVFFVPVSMRLPFSILIASFASLMFSGRALAMDNRLYEHMVGKSMIQLTSKRIFYRGLFIFLGGLFGGVLTKLTLPTSHTMISFMSKLHIVFLFSSFIRFIIWIKYLRNKKFII